MNYRAMRTIIQTPGCFKSMAFSPAITKGRKFTPYYIDLRNIPSYPESMETITDELGDLIKKKVKAYDRVITTEAAGIPYGTVIAKSLRVGLCWIKKEAKAYGLEKKDIEGVLNKDEVALGIDDLVNEANTAKKVIDAVRKRDAIITDYLAVHDRMQGASEILRKLNVRLGSLSQTTSQFMEMARDLKRAPEEEYPILVEYCYDQNGWSRKFVKDHPEYLREKLANVVTKGSITDMAPLEVLTVGHPDLKEEFAPEVRKWLKELYVAQEVPAFDYIPSSAFCLS